MYFENDEKNNLVNWLFFLDKLKLIGMILEMRNKIKLIKKFDEFLMKN